LLEVAAVVLMPLDQLQLVLEDQEVEAKVVKDLLQEL
tara:strand:+ start:518 stop:628 length:111 start_codon:yes stop_codon:yes gene_type:complete